MAEQRSTSGRFIERFKRPIAAVALSAAAALSVNACGFVSRQDQPKRTQEFQQPPLQNKNIVVIGDSETQGAVVYGKLWAQLKYVGFNPLVLDGEPGHSLVDGTPNSGLNMIARWAPQIHQSGTAAIPSTSTPICATNPLIVTGAIMSTPKTTQPGKSTATRLLRPWLTGFR